MCCPCPHPRGRGAGTQESFYPCRFILTPSPARPILHPGRGARPAGPGRAEEEGMDSNAQNLIDQSTGDDDLVVAEWDEETAADLLAWCEDWVDTFDQDGRPVREYWGTHDDEGRDASWRVHLVGGPRV